MNAGINSIFYKKGRSSSWLPRTFFALILCVLNIQFQTASAAQDTNNFEENYAAWVVLLDRIDRVVSNPQTSQEERQAVRYQLEYIYEEVSQQSVAITAQHEKVTALLDIIGNPTEQESPNPSLLAQYLKFSAQQKALTTYKTQIAFIKARADNLLSQANSDIQSKRWQRLIRQNPFPFLPGTWHTALPELQVSVTRILYGPFNWLVQGQWWQKFASVAVFAIAAYVVMLMLAVIVNKALKKRLIYRDINEPSFQARLLYAIGQTVAKCALPMAIILGGAILFLALGLVSPQESIMMVTGVTNISLIIVSFVASQTFLMPDNNTWRVIDIDEPFAKRLRTNTIMLASVLAVSGIFSTVSAQGTYSPELDAVLTFIFGGSLSVLLIALLKLLAPTNFKGQAVEGEDQFTITLWSRLRLVGFILVGVALLATLSGYSNLSRYILVAVISTVLILVFCLIIRALAQSLVGYLLIMGSRADKNAPPVNEDGTHKTLHFLLSFSLDSIITITGAVFIMSAWGVPPEDFLTMSSSALQGFQIGDYSFSILDLGLAVVAFVVMLVLTRAAQWILAERILPQTRVDMGVRHSIKTGTGYIGLILGAMISISVLGIDLTNLALVAGALSVGIGFGLQTMVNNFISGIILLIERPIKVGDWVVVGDKEGHVKHINVRATEITTFQRATIIIPNSEILSGSVVNWTHKDVRGRVEIPIGVAYGSDTALVRQTLLSTVKGHLDILNYPEPMVVFHGFGASSLDFELRFFVRSVDKMVPVRTEIMYALDEAMKKARIEIPYPHQVVEYKPTKTNHNRRQFKLPYRKSRLTRPSQSPAPRHDKEV